MKELSQNSDDAFDAVVKHKAALFGRYRRARENETRVTVLLRVSKMQASRRPRAVTLAPSTFISAAGAA